MPKRAEPIKIERFETVPSTSALARRAALEGRLNGRPRLFLARSQSAGVGRFGRLWASPVGGLWFTLAWPIRTNEAPILDGLGLRLGVACANAIEQVLRSSNVNKPVQLKWPNDVLINGKKVAGLLTEIAGKTMTRWAIIGVGVNGDFPRADLPIALREYATTLQEEMAGDLDLDKLFEDLSDRLQQALEEEGLSAETLAEARRMLFGMGQTATLSLPDGQSATGVVRGLDENGRLILHTQAGPWTAPANAELAF